MTGDLSVHSRAGARRWLGGMLVVLLVAGGALAWRLGYAEEWIDRLRAEAGTSEPAEIDPPPELALPPVAAPDPVARPAAIGPPLDTAAIEQALAGYFTEPDLGPHRLAVVAPLAGGGSGYERIEGRPKAVPASITKVVTATAALAVLGPDHTFTTRTVLASETDTTPEVVLIGGGDPYLASEPPEEQEGATFDVDRPLLGKLAKRTARALKKRDVRSVRLSYDASLFTGPAGHPTWREDPELEVGDYIGDELIAPISALWVDQGRALEGWGREPDPPGAAAGLFAADLRARGIEVEFAGSAVAPPAALPLAELHGAPVGDIVQRLLEVSDNSAAEVMLRHIGLAVEGEGSFAAGQAGVRRTLAGLGVEMGSSVLYDGSGLSRENEVSPQLLVDVIRLAADPAHPELRAALTGMPVAGFTGSLAERMEEVPTRGLGRVRAKTGTLTGVTTLAGIAVDLDGTPLVFVLMADRVPEDSDLDAQDAQHAAAIGLGLCHCTR